MKAMFEVNVFGLIACTKACLPVMLHAKSGHIINIASQAYRIGDAEIKPLFRNETRRFRVFQCAAA